MCVYRFSNHRNAKLENGVPSVGHKALFQCVVMTRFILRTMVMQLIFVYCVHFCLQG